ncbi:MAG: PIN domain-containing protein [Bacteroidetes bacterium]|nr:PIN domain-containing protein [Bacteroidota bacterium]
MKLKIVIDTGFWIALFDPAKDPKNSLEAERIADEIEDEELIIPFPTLYEFLNSRLSRREAKIQLERLLSRPNVIKLPDTKYKELALENFFLKSKSFYSDISLADEVIKLMLADKSLKIDYIAAFDQGLINDAMAQGIKKL